MGLSLGFYSFGDCLPPSSTDCYILDANYSIDCGVEIKKALYYLVYDEELDEQLIHIEYAQDNYSCTFGYLSSPKWNLLSNMYWISQKDYLQSFNN